MPSTRLPRRGLSVLSVLVLAALTASPAAAHRAGACTTDTTLDRCEQWSQVYNDDTTTAPARPDEFSTTVATNSASVFTVLRSTKHNPDDPYSTAADWVVLAHDTNTGALQWEARRRSRHYDSPLAATTSKDGKTLFVTGAAYNGYPVGNATDAHIVLVAYDAATGQELWSRTWDNHPDATDTAKTIAVAPNGKTVVVAGVTQNAGNQLDYVTVAFDVARGRELWSRIHHGLRPGGTDSLNDIAMSPRGDLVYVTGASAGAAEYDADYVTIAYDVRKGKVAWQQRFTGIDQLGSDRAAAITTSPDGSTVYVTGDSLGQRRPGATTTQYDYATVAYDARSGAQRWVGRYGGPTPGFNAPIGIVASADRVVVTGQSRGATPEDIRDYGTVAYDATTGAEAWQTRYAPPNSDEIALDLALSPDGTTAFVTGSSSPVVRYTDLDEAVTVAYATATGATAWTSRIDVGAGNAASGRHLAATDDGGVAMVGQTVYSADPFKGPSQNIYDTIIVRY